MAISHRPGKKIPAMVPADVEPKETIPTPEGFPIVGIGASAGGLAAFEAFFSGMPADTDPGMAFILVQHLAPDHKSILTELIQRYTRMQVYEVEDGMVVRPNCAYIIPPNRDMAFLHGSLQLLEPTAPRGQRLPIDFFFRSLAQDQREHAICVVLSGTGSDGTLGVRAIKGEGGMCMAQNPDSTEYDGMPRNAIATGLVDYVLAAAEMPAQILSYVAYAFGHAATSPIIPASGTENDLKKIFILLRVQTGHDFSHYKMNTIQRRIERRMAVHQILTLSAYVKYLQQTPLEVEALFRDLLIGVTSFFRDPEAFQALETEAIPRIFAGKPLDGTVRVWIPGCSTGEEAYSIAVLLQERIEEMKQSYKVQVFATDIDSQSIAIARTGIYPASIVADVSPARLARFFVPEADGSAYRVHKNIRDMLVFSEQNVIKDPPFSRLDLISCRNLMIYLDGDLQKRVIPLFHYSLLPEGLLFLGNSETVGEHGDLFLSIDRKAKIYRRKDDFHAVQRIAFGLFPINPVQQDAHNTGKFGKSTLPGKIPLRDITEQALLQHANLAGVLVTDRGDILYIHGKTGNHLEPVAGEPGVNNILRMAREGLQNSLTLTLRKAVATHETVLCPGLRIRSNQTVTTVDLTVHPVKSSPSIGTDSFLYLVVFEDARPTERSAVEPASRSGEPLTDTETRIANLKQELRDKEEYLQTANEELETANEELKSANEEMQSVNEELQSTNEELETSKEELQSVNEELATVNAELQTKVADLSRANNDMNNLLAGIGVGTIFVDHQLRILRFTPSATQVINLIRSDVGRPVAHVVTNLVDYRRLIPDVQEVLDTLATKEIDVRTLDGHCYRMRILPYRTLENVIEGAVITFFDITEMRRTEDELRKTQAVLKDVRKGTFDDGHDGR